MPRHVVFVCGGAVAGSEAAAVFSSRGILTVVFEQNTRPYGKIEDGLPRWHDKLRQKEYALIDEHLTLPGVLFVPRVRIGRDIATTELAVELGPNAVVLANGAWRDRPLPVPGADAFVGRGLVYQNPFVHWFNHATEPGSAEDHATEDIVIPDGTIVVGGGLASIDVVKIVNLELYRQALAGRGVDVSTIELEHAGIPTVAQRHGVSTDELGVRGATLYYRRRKCDMPLAEMPDRPSAAEVEKTERVRVKIMDNVARKYLVRLEELHVPVAALVDGDRLSGLRFRRSEVHGGRVREVVGSEYDVRAPLVVSSIGSIPEPLDGVPQQGELYAWTDRDRGELAELPNVYGLGNVLTGKGNIKVSRDNARQIATQVADAVLRTEPLAPARVRAILQRIEVLWQERGYETYADWLNRSPPLERR